MYASYQNVVKAFKRGQEVNTYLGHEGEVQFILPFGEHLISIDDSNVMRIWHSVSKGVSDSVQQHTTPILIIEIFTASVFRKCIVLLVTALY